MRSHNRGATNKVRNVVSHIHAHGTSEEGPRASVEANMSRKHSIYMQNINFIYFNWLLPYSYALQLVTHFLYRYMYSTHLYRRFLFSQFVLFIYQLKILVVSFVSYAATSKQFSRWRVFVILFKCFLFDYLIKKKNCILPILMQNVRFATVRIWLNEQLLTISKNRKTDRKLITFFKTVFVLLTFIRFKSRSRRDSSNFKLTYLKQNIRINNFLGKFSTSF